MRRYHVHFVCRGNVYRSRVAEAYLRALKLKHIDFSSSGIEAWDYYHDYPKETIAPYALIAADQLGVAAQLPKTWTQTTEELLGSADLIVFMSRDVYRDARAKFQFNPDKALVWNVGDVSGSDRSHHGRRYIQALQRHLGTNVPKLRRLGNKLSRDVRMSWSDVIDETNTELGFRLPVRLIGAKGLWRRGCHAIITTTDGKYLVEKRSSSIIYSPGQLDISLGGGVDAGESPLQAIQRETREEIGLTLPPESFRLLNTRKWSSYHPKYRHHTRIFLSTYHASIAAAEELDFVPEESEVEKIRLLSHRQLRRLLRRHYLVHLGRLKYGYSYIREMIDTLQKEQTKA